MRAGLVLAVRLGYMYIIKSRPATELKGGLVTGPDQRLRPQQSGTQKLTLTLDSPVLIKPYKGRITVGRGAWLYVYYQASAGDRAQGRLGDRARQTIKAPAVWNEKTNPNPR